MRFMLVGVAALGLIGSPVGAQTAHFSNSDRLQVEVIDGDTFRLGDIVYRLWGIDALELDQPCYATTNEFGPVGEALVLGDTTSEALVRELVDIDHCVTRDIDRYGRTIAQCFDTRGTDIGGFLVRIGAAFDYPQYSGGEYSDEQAAAQQMGWGYWMPIMTCDPPWEWRAR